MLLFEWGTFDWGDGPRFEVDITRHFIFGEGEDENIWQLWIKCQFAPSEVTPAGKPSTSRSVTGRQIVRFENDGDADPCLSLDSFPGKCAHLEAAYFFNMRRKSSCSR